MAWELMKHQDAVKKTEDTRLQAHLQFHDSSFFKVRLRNTSRKYDKNAGSFIEHSVERVILRVVPLRQVRHEISSPTLREK